MRGPTTQGVLVTVGCAWLSACAGSAPNGNPPDFVLQDVNPASTTYEQAVGPSDFQGEVSAWYFGWATCPRCQAHIDALEPLFAGDDIQGAPLRVTLLGINEAGYESGNDVMLDGHTLPWLQDDTQVDVFGAWPPAQIRELKIVDGSGVVTSTFDLNEQDPADELHADAIVAAVLDAAGGP